MENGSLKELISHRDLLNAWTMRIIRARYQQSILGGLWAILQPVATVAIFTTVFSLFLKVDTQGFPYAVFAYSALVPWMLFSTSITDMVDSIVSNMNLVAKIYFPREVLVIAAMLARLIDFVIAYSLLIFLMIFYDLPVFQISWAFLPLILLVQISLAVGIGFFAAALNAFYRDVKHLAALGLQLWLYATPIIYPSSLVPESLRPFYYLNPMAGVIESYRSVILNGGSVTAEFWISALISAVVLLVGYTFFKRVEYRFADII